ncbi:MAG: dTDP-4-dehydrorhamnose reductase [Candidatus Methanomethyliaceae archaeon]
MRKNRLASSKRREAERRCVVTGAAGMLGTALVPALRELGFRVYATDIVVDRPDIDPLDVRDLDALDAYFRKTAPMIVFHLAAETDVDKCELDPDHAFLTNVIGTQNVCIAARRVNATVFYISTAGVFDGMKSEPYTEFDEPNPINVYGKTKFEAEKIVKDLCQRYFIVRAGWMIGGGRKDKKFVAKILMQLRKGARILYVVNDKFGTPTYTVDFSRVICKLAETDWYGLYHAACTGEGSRLDVAREILSFLGRDDVELVPVPSEFFRNSYPAPRPRSEMMRNYMLELRGLNIMRSWKEALREYLATNYKDIGGDLL